MFSSGWKRHIIRTTNTYLKGYSFKRVPGLLFQGTHPLTQLAPFLESLFSLPSFLFHPLLRYFSISTPSCPNPTLQPSLLIISRFKQISKVWFYQLNCCFLSKINFWFFSNAFTNIFGYLNLWDIFRFIFRQLRMTFFHKIMMAEKNFFSSNA